MATAHKHADILRAIADGKVVEYKIEGKWNTRLTEYTNPLTTPYLEWRIKPEKKIAWLNIYPDINGDSNSTSDCGIMYHSKEEADKLRYPGRLACIKIEYEHGEGL